MSRSGVNIELDPEVAASLKVRRNRRLHTVQIPALRLIGFVFFAAGVGLHNWLVLGEVSWPTVLGFLAVLVAYCGVSWLVLLGFFGRTGRLNLGDLFLGVDIVFLTAAVYLSGGEQSWIFFIPLGRVADQAVGGFRRTVVFSHLCMLSFMLMLVWIALVDGRALALAPTLAKASFFYLGGWYIALCALPMERRRESIGAAIRTARLLIARLKVATGALEEARLHAEAANEAKSQFLNTMSHEMRTPLGVVIGTAELLGTTRLDRQQRELLAHLRNGADATLRLVSDALDYAALDRGPVDLERVTFSPSAVVRDVVEEFGPAAEGKGLELHAAGDERLPVEVVGDRRRCRQLLRLLVDNAVKFTAAGRVTVGCGTTEAEAGGALLRWTVSDTGIGFDVADLPRLAQPFVQAEGGVTRSFEGAGLGLALARRLAEAMGGTLEATSTPGRGSTFWVDTRVECPA